MKKTSPSGDRSAGAVYQAEHDLAKLMERPGRRIRLGTEIVTLPPPLHFGELSAVQLFVDSVLSDPLTKTNEPSTTVQVRAIRGFRRATYANNVISIPAVHRRGSWALSRQVVLHELAHHLSGDLKHGLPFRSTLVELTATHVGEPAAQVLTQLFAPIDALPDPDRDLAGSNDQVRRVAALLAKAESTESAAEAEAYLAKATELASRHSIELAVSTMNSTSSPRLTHRMTTIGFAGRSLNAHLVALFLAIARRFGVKLDVGRGNTYVISYGLPADLDQVEAVFVVAGAMMVARCQEYVRAGTWKGDRYTDSSGVNRPVSAAVATSAFCIGFGERIGQRITQTVESAKRPMPNEPGDHPTSTPVSEELALRNRDLLVKDYYRATTRAKGTWNGRRTGPESLSRNAGRRAADSFAMAPVEPSVSRLKIVGR